MKSFETTDTSIPNPLCQQLVSLIDTALAKRGWTEEELSKAIGYPVEQVKEQIDAWRDNDLSKTYLSTLVIMFNPLGELDIEINKSEEK